MGNFSKASLNGHYAYQLRGLVFPTVSSSGFEFRESGVFTADGAGNISSGEDDFLAVGSGISHDTITGSYSIRNDGAGLAVISFGPGGVNGSITLAFNMVSPSRLNIIEVDTFATSAGSAVLQDPNVIASTPSGTFAFHMHSAVSSNGVNSVARVGEFTIASGVASGNEDVLTQGGVAQPRTLTGSFNAPDASGRGTGTITDSALVTTSFVYFVVDANTVRFMIDDLGVIGLGAAEKQSAGPFTSASLNGSYAFGTRGDTLVFGTDGVSTVGRFTTDGAGSVSAGAFDQVQDGTTSGNVTFTGTYSVNPNGLGEATLTLTPSVGATITQTYWLVSPNRAFLLVDDVNKVEDGSADTQQAITYTNSTLSGQFAFGMHGFNLNDTFDRVGTIIPNNGNVTFTYFLNRSGVITLDSQNQPATISLTGTYAASGNVTGRYTGNVNTLSNNLVFYMFSATDGYILQADTNTQIDGNMSKQP